MTVFEYNNDMIIVNAGLMFPEEDMLGVDFIILDFSYVFDNIEKVRGLILTYGHEDYKGAIPIVIERNLYDYLRNTTYLWTLQEQAP